MPEQLRSFPTYKYLCTEIVRLLYGAAAAENITKGALRKDGQATLPLPSAWKKEELVAYLGFYDPASERVSNSLFLTVGETV